VTGTDTVTDVGRTFMNDKRNIALLLSFDPQIGPSKLELAVENDELVTTYADDTTTSYSVIKIPDIATALEFIEDGSTHDSIGLIAYYDTPANAEVIRIVLNRITGVLPSNVTVAQYVENETGPSLKKVEEDATPTILDGFRSPRGDPLYDHVNFVFREGQTVSWLPHHVVKATHDDLGSGLSISELAQINEAAMAFYDFGVPTIADYNTGKVVMDHVGLISYDLLREIRRSIKNLGKKTSSTVPKFEMLKHVKDMLLYTQLIKLAQHQSNPFIPTYANGEEEINVTPDLISYYEDTLRISLDCKKDVLRREAFDKSIGAFLSLISGGEDRVVRYMDMYQRNHGIQHSDVSSLKDLQSVLDGLNSRESQASFLQSNFKQVDVHRILRTSLDLEDFWHIISDPALKLNQTSESAWYKIFLGIKEFYDECSLPEEIRNEKKIELLGSAISNHEFIDPIVLDSLLEKNKPDDAYLLGMKIFRTTRWFDLIGGKYIPKYMVKRAEACDKFEMLLRDDVVKAQADGLNHFMAGVGNTPPGRLRYIRFITDALTRQDAQEILKMGIAFDPSQTTGLENIFDSHRRIADAIARINTLSGCSRWLESYRSDLAGYKTSAYSAFNQALDLMLSKLSSQEINLNGGMVKYQIKKAPSKNTSNNYLTLNRGIEPVLGIQQYVSVLNELSRNLTPNSEGFYRTVQLMTLRTLYHTKQLNVGGK
jgi:hypothetical protein